MKLEEALSKGFLEFLKDNYPNELEAGIGYIKKGDMHNFKATIRNTLNHALGHYGTDIFDLCPLEVMSKVGFSFKIIDSHLGRDIVIPDDYDYLEIETIIKDETFTIERLRTADKLKRGFGGKIV